MMTGVELLSRLSKSISLVRYKRGNPQLMHMRGYKPEAWGRLLVRHGSKVDMIGDLRITRLQLNLELCILSLLLAPSMKRDMSSDFKMILAVGATCNMPAAQYGLSTSENRLFINFRLGKRRDHERAADGGAVDVADCKDWSWIFVFGYVQVGIAGVEVVRRAAVVLIPIT